MPTLPSCTNMGLVKSLIIEYIYLTSFHPPLLLPRPSLYYYTLHVNFSSITYYNTTITYITTPIFHITKKIKCIALPNLHITKIIPYITVSNYFNKTYLTISYPSYIIPYQTITLPYPLHTSSHHLRYN